MSSRETAIVFDDGSLESKVLQFELKTSYDITVIPVSQYKRLETWLNEASIDTTKILKIFLHFPFEDYLLKDIRTEISEASHNNPNLRIIPWYEQASRESIKNRAANYGVKAEPPIIFKKVKETEIASDIISPEPIGGHEAPSDDFVSKLKKSKRKK